MTVIKSTFAALEVRNYRLFFMGQTASVTGSWIQKLAQAWLVLDLTGSGVILGTVAAIQQLPTLLLTPYGGVMADRYDKRRILEVVALISASCALALGLVTALGHVQVWMICLFAVLLGTADALEKPTRQAFIVDLVGSETTANATTLSAVVQQAGKTFGPALAGLSIVAFGVAASFFLNAISFLIVFVMLALMPTSELRETVRVVHEPKQLRSGLRYVMRTPELRIPLLIMCVVGTMAFEWIVTLPMLASGPFEGGPDVLATMFSCMGVGAIIGGLAIAGNLRPSLNSLAVSAALFGGFVLVTSAAPNLVTFGIGLAFVGATAVAIKAIVTSHLQLHSLPQMRGRVLALLVVSIGGTTAFGGPLVGWIGAQWGPRLALAQGGVVALFASGSVLLAVLIRNRQQRQSAMTSA